MGLASLGAVCRQDSHPGPASWLCNYTLYQLKLAISAAGPFRSQSGAHFLLLGQYTEELRERTQFGEI